MLANILAHIVACEGKEKNDDTAKVVSRFEEQLASELLDKNTIKRYQLELQIQTALKKQNTAVKKIYVLESLEATKAKNSRFDQRWNDMQLDRAKRNDEEISVHLLECSIKLKFLNAEREFLKSIIEH